MINCTIYGKIIIYFLGAILLLLTLYYSSRPRDGDGLAPTRIHKVVPSRLLHRKKENIVIRSMELSSSVFESTLIFTITPPLNRHELLNTLRTMIGSFHQYRDGKGRTPEIIIFIDGVATPKVVFEELSWWKRVKFYNLARYLGISHLNYDRSDPILVESLMRRLISEYSQSTSIWWTRFGNVFDPERGSLVDWKGADNELLETLQNGRGLLERVSRQIGQMSSCITASQYPENSQLLLDEDGMPSLNNPIVFFACSPNVKRVASITELSPKISIDQLGFKGDDVDTSACYIDIVDYIPFTNSLLSPSITLSSKVHDEIISKEDNIEGRIKVAIAFPATSKNNQKGNDPVFLHFLLPSLLRTLTREELNHYLITIYIGIDNKDPMLTKSSIRENMIEAVQEMITDFPIKVEFITLPNGRRVAHIWNILFERAMSDDNQYFYQVNDDLIMLSLGWLSYFVRLLKEQNDIGVVGPADTFYNFDCKLLTQAMVSRVHYDIFGYLYPTEFKDWQSDTWLTNVYTYPHNLMHCNSNYWVKNGGKSTRYRPCILRTFGILTKEGSKKIYNYLESSRR